MQGVSVSEDLGRRRRRLVHAIDSLAVSVLLTTSFATVLQAYGAPDGNHELLYACNLLKVSIGSANAEVFK